MILQSWQTEFFENLKNDKKTTPMQIYENSIMGGKISSLRVTFSAVVSLIGEAAFDCIASSYLLHHKDSPVDIGLLGIAFPVYLQQHDIILHLPYIADLAKLEWQRHLVFESSEGSSLIEQYEYAVDCIWVCCQKDYRGNFDVDVARLPVTIKMIRQGLQVIMRRI